MKRTDLEHIIRAAGSITGDDEIIVIGSQAILAQYPDAPEELLRSVEADIIPRNAPHLSDLLDGSIGELSPFHMTFGYYAHGVGKETAILPNGWEQRLVSIRSQNTRGVTGWCLEVHDLMAAKLAAGRHRDLEFVAGAIRNHMVNREILLKRVDESELTEERKSQIQRRISSFFAAAGKGR